MIPAIGSSAFDSTGERRLAERLEQKLDADYLLWHNVPIGPKQTHPDFVVLHARRGLLVLVIKHDDGIPLLKPVSCGREGQTPVIIKLPTLRDEAFAMPTTWPAPTKKATPGATWPCCAPTGKPWTCAPAPWPNARCRSACARRVVNTSPARMRFR